MKILLLVPPNRFQSRIHLGFGYIAAFLEQNGYSNIKIYDLFNCSQTFIKNIIVSEKPDICGISCLTDDREAAFSLASLIKSMSPNTLIVLGNIHASVMWEQILTHYPSIDVIVRGEGERVMLNLVDAYEHGENFEKIRGIAYRKLNTIACNEDEPLIEDLDSLPYPAYHLFTLDLKRVFTIMTSRGCPYMCSFCSNSHFWGGRWRARSVDNVLGEIDLLVTKYKMKNLTFEDDYFIFDQKRAIEICKGIIAGNYHFEWSTKGRVDRVAHGKLSKEMFEWMEKAGCRRLSFGIESGSPEILANIGKKITPQEVVDAYSILTNSSKISPCGTLMVGNPGESEKSIDQTIELLRKLPLRRSQFANIAIALTRVYPGTRLYNLSKQNHFLSDSVWLSNGYAPIYTAELPLRELYRLKQKINFALFSLMGAFQVIPYIVSRIFPTRSAAKSKNNLYKLLTNILYMVSKKKKIPR
jgi:anaerobic magnesium-protoporphyrin IX monomethyl ester cyclase